MFDNKVAVITGGANGIGKCIAEEFKKHGAEVCVIDKAEGDHFVGDISDKAVLERFAAEVLEKYGHIDYLINNALPLMKALTSAATRSFSMRCRWALLRRFIFLSFLLHISAKAAVSSISPHQETE